MRTLKLQAIMDGTYEKNLRELGFSVAICSNLRKSMSCIKDTNNIPHKIVDTLHKGDVFYINLLEETSQTSIDPYDVELEFVYEDEDIAVINKPYNLAVINTHSHYGKSLQNALVQYFGPKYVYRPVNRLDRDTSGLMIIAKNQLAHSFLSKEHISRSYLALCNGTGLQDGVINKPIGLKEGSTMERCVTSSGKSAITHYKILKEYTDYSLVELSLDTGRTHQIRVHMAYLGHPLLMDSLYGNCSKEYILENGFVLNRQALHSYMIEFKHPVSLQPIKLINLPDFVDKTSINIDTTCGQ